MCVLWLYNFYFQIIPSFPQRKISEPNSSGQIIVHETNIESNVCDNNIAQTFNNVYNCNNKNDYSSNVPSYSSHHTNQLIKDNVIRELLDTEINYVNLLSSLYVG